MYSSYEESADEETEQASETDNLFKMDYRYMIVSPEGEMRIFRSPLIWTIMKSSQIAGTHRITDCFASQGGASLRNQSGGRSVNKAV